MIRFQVSTSRKRYLFREEYFGWTFYDRDLLRHAFLIKDELENHLKKLNVKRNDCIFLNAPEKNFRQDIVYSPIRTYYELSLGCNIQCRYCFNNSGNKRPHELTTTEIIKSLYNFKRANVLDIRFTGGEPLIHPDWYVVFKKAIDLGFAVSVNTNGVCESNLIYDKLASLNLNQISISIDGKKEHHEANRGKGTFRKTINTLKELYKRGANLRINVLITQSSLNDVDYMVDLASKYAKEINFFAVRFFGRGKEYETKESVSFKNFFQMAKKAEKLKNKHPQLNILHFEQALTDNSLKKELNNKFGLSLRAPDGSTRFNVTSDGRLWAGGFIPYIDDSLNLGDVRKDDVFQIWQNSKKLDVYRKSSSDLVEFCSKCPDFMKKCPGTNYERELYQKKHPGSSYCIYSNRSSLKKI